MSLNKRNNIKLEIKAPMTSVGTLLVVDKGTLLGEDFANDETKNFSLTLFKLEGDVPVQIEIAEVIAKSGNNLTLRRAVEPCPMNYGAGEMVQQAYDFDVGDVAYMNLTAGDIDEILEMIKDTNGRIDDVERDYVTQEQLELEKGTTIATLENGKIPGTQINTATLEVAALNQEFVAGEDINAGDVVSIGYEFKTISPLTSNKIVGPGGGASVPIDYSTLPEITSFQLEAGSIITSLRLVARNNMDGYNVDAVYYVMNKNKTEVFWEGLGGRFPYGSFQSKHITCGFTKPITQTGTYKLCIKGYHYQYQYSNVTLSPLTQIVYLAQKTNKVYKTTSYNQNFIGIARADALSGENVSIALHGPTFVKYNGNLNIGTNYFISKDTGGLVVNNQIFCVGTAVSSNSIICSKNYNILGETIQINTRVYNMTYQTTWSIYHYTGITPKSVTTSLGSVTSFDDVCVNINYTPTPAYTDNDTYIDLTITLNF